MHTHSLLISFDTTAAVLRLAGEVDLVARSDLRHRLDDVLALGCTRLELDVGEVTFIDCASVRALAGAQRRLERLGGSLVVTARSSVFTLVARLMGFDELLVDEMQPVGVVPGGGYVEKTLTPHERKHRRSTSDGR